jgi:hypothetical protein
MAGKDATYEHLLVALRGGDSACIQSTIAAAQARQPALIVEVLQDPEFSHRLADPDIRAAFARAVAAWQATWPWQGRGAWFVKWV